MSKFSEIISHMRGVARDREMDAAFDGDRTGGGSTELMNQIYIFECGLMGVLPSGWKKYEQEIKAQQDPDREAYERYKKKYG